MIPKKISLIFLFVISISGCSAINGFPACDSPEVKGIIKDIAAGYIYYTDDHEIQETSYVVKKETAADDGNSKSCLIGVGVARVSKNNPSDSPIREYRDIALTIYKKNQDGKRPYDYIDLTTPPEPAGAQDPY